MNFMPASSPWYLDVKELWASPGDFFPTASQTDAERLNATVRLVAYSSLAAALVARKPRYIIVGLVAIAVLSASYSLTSKDQDHEAAFPRETVQRRDTKCTRPTKDNPFMNFLPFDDPKKPPACPPDEKITKEIYKNFNKGIVRDAYDVIYGWENTGPFMTMPVTTKVPDTIGFANAVYGPRSDTERRPVIMYDRGSMDQANSMVF
jgi:hypothetical protein